MSRYWLLLFLLLWCTLFLMARSSTTKSKGLRGGELEEKVRLNMVPAVDVVADTDSSNRKNAEPNHAIIVAGHAVLRMNQLGVADVKDIGWYLLPYQLDQGFPTIISSHIRKGLSLAASDYQSLLFFSGGQTRRDVGPTSEGASYYYLAQEKKWMSASVANRVYLEEYARDSYENLLFSLCRFREVTGKYPSKVTVIGFDFKGQRFSELHRKAIGYPASNFTYVGMKPATKLFNHVRAADGERDAVKQFYKDMYGCNDPALKHKRDARNPFKRTIPYELACPEMSELLKWCGPGLFDTGKVPWDTVKL
jgi:hypothetical protein